MATGIKIIDVDSTRASIWTRLTRSPERVDDHHPMPVIRYRVPGETELVKKTKRFRDPRAVPQVSFPEGSTLETIEGACPGVPGRVRIHYRAAQRDPWHTTPWYTVDPQRDFTRVIPLEDLKPATRYTIRVQGFRAGASEPDTALAGTFCTAPLAHQSSDVKFVVSSCQAYHHQDRRNGGVKIYEHILNLNPDFFVHSGDAVYYDQWAKNIHLARWVWHRMFSLPTHLNFYRQIASYVIKDDHNTWVNDCYPGMKTNYMGDFSFQQGQAVFREQVGLKDNLWRTVRWGQDLHIWLVEGRDYRSPNPMEDGPEKTIWGEQQKDWFKQTVNESDATFRILISPTPLVGPDRPRKQDNHANDAFAHEGNELRRFIASQENMMVICGDRHWQYVSTDPETGLREFGCGPASDPHAESFDPAEKAFMLDYLNIRGGFLTVTVDRKNSVPSICFDHYGVDGNRLHRNILSAR